MAYYIFKFFQIWSFFAIATILFSFIVMCSTYNIFKSAGKKADLAFIPIYNLLILLDIAQMSRLYFILLLFPVANILVMFLIMYRLSIVFRTSTPFALGLIFLFVIFLPILNFSKYLKVEGEEEKKEDDVSDAMMPLLTEKQYNELNNIPDDTPKIDNVFRTEIKQIEPAPTFKANRVKYREMVLPEEKIEEIKRVEPVPVKELNSNRFIREDITEEDDSIEIVEL